VAFAGQHGDVDGLRAAALRLNDDRHPAFTPAGATTSRAVRLAAVTWALACRRGPCCRPPAACFPVRVTFCPARRCGRDRGPRAASLEQEEPHEPAITAGRRHRQDRRSGRRQRRPPAPRTARPLPQAGRAFRAAAAELQCRGRSRLLDGIDSSSVWYWACRLGGRRLGEGGGQARGGGSAGGQDGAGGAGAAVEEGGGGSGAGGGGGGRRVATDGGGGRPGRLAGRDGRQRRGEEGRPRPLRAPPRWPERRAGRRRPRRRTARRRSCRRGRTPAARRARRARARAGPSFSRVGDPGCASKSAGAAASLARAGDATGAAPARRKRNFALPMAPGGPRQTSSPSTSV
jgi:hypothetical protein